MTTVYFDENGKLAMTDYCVVGNHPTMTLVKGTAKEFIFEVDSKNPLEHQPHMQSLTVKFIGPDYIEHRWTMAQPGKEGNSTKLVLNQVP